jgi:peptidoglycan hydrolase-like protein with peptidoglycan-binding domain
METIMRKAVLTALVLAAISGLAVAQEGDLSGQSSTGQPIQLPSPASPDSSDSSQLSISPQQLNSSQVRDLQQALKAKGHRAVRVDGEWGPDIEAAVKNFQKSQNMVSQTGALDLPTIAALGLDPLSFGLTGETTGKAPRSVSQQQQRQGTSQPMPQNGGRQAR